MNQNYSNEMSRPNGHKQNNKKYRHRMRAAIMRVKAVRRVGKTTEPRQEKVAAVVFGDVISRFYTSESFFTEYSALSD